MLRTASTIPGAGSDTSLPLGRCSVIDTYLTSILTASVDVGDGGGEGIPVLDMLEEDGELCPLHAEVAPIELVMNRGECI